MYFALYIILAISFNQRQTSIGSLAFLIIFFMPLISNLYVIIDNSC